jgi:hypothetical protein
MLVLNLGFIAELVGVLTAAVFGVRFLRSKPDHKQVQSRAVQTHTASE